MLYRNENSPTLGSLNTTDHEKRIFAHKSRDFNLKDKVFCELFEELASKLREDAEKEKELLASGQQTVRQDSSSTSV